MSSGGPFRSGATGDSLKTIVGALLFVFGAIWSRPRPFPHGRVRVRELRIPRREPPAVGNLGVGPDRIGSRSARRIRGTPTHRCSNSIAQRRSNGAENETGLAERVDLQGCAGAEIRTRMPSRAADFKSAASAFPPLRPAEAYPRRGVTRGALVTRGRAGSPRLPCPARASCRVARPPGGRPARALRRPRSRTRPAR